MSSIIKVNTFQDANGNALFSSDGSGNVTLSASDLKSTPAFLVRNGGTGQSLSDDTKTKVTAFDSADYDTDSAWNASTSLFTVPSGKGGKYFIYGALKYSGSSSRRITIFVTKNGSDLIKCANNVSYYSGVNLALVADLSASDYLELYCKIDQGGGGTIGGDSNEEFFGAYRIIGA